jgi:3-dehydroquinate synthase
LRGVPLVHVPTTLLAMVDAAIGGKTGVNFPLPASSDLGKNLIGALWQPKTVLCDPKALATLPPREFACGLAECVKHAIIADAPLLHWLHRNAREIVTPAVALSKAEELIARCAAIKAAIVAEDEREHGRRALLNLGHTFGHALESISALGLRHGEAVALGLIAAVDVSRSTQRLSSEAASLIRETLERCSLPITLATGGLPDRTAVPDHWSRAAWLAPESVTIDRLMSAMAFDKKVAGGRLRLVLPCEIGRVLLVDSVPEPVIRQAWRALGALP